MINLKTKPLRRLVVSLLSISMIGSIVVITKANANSTTKTDAPIEIEIEEENNQSSESRVMPIYRYQEQNFSEEYDFEIQKEIWYQYRNFEGELPPYEMVIALWVAESGLDPDSISYNQDGTFNKGIPQLNSLTIQDCIDRGWYKEGIESLDDYRTQIRLGLLVLNDLCVTVPGGEWDYYRVVRAYQIGVGGLLEKEASGDFGSNDPWYEGKDGIWYPGFYGKVKHIQKNLVVDAYLYVYEK